MPWSSPRNWDFPTKMVKKTIQYEKTVTTAEEFVICDKCGLECEDDGEKLYFNPSIDKDMDDFLGRRTPTTQQQANELLWKIKKDGVGPRRLRSSL
jgi:hypothetical protein